MKKLTLNEAWRLCLKQWKWIVEQLAKDDCLFVSDLKFQWCQKNGFEDVRNNCFFCEYGCQQKPPKTATTCAKCPGRQIDPTFGCCNITYDYAIYPQKFYAKLLELDKKRKSKKVATN